MPSVTKAQMTNIRAPMAFTIADLSDDEHVDKFTITDGHIRVRERLRSSDPEDHLNYRDLTGTDKILFQFSPQLSQDHIGGEDYWTTKETNVRNGVYTSLHGMVLGGRSRQHFHYHPPGSDDMPESSLRVVLLAPLKNIGQQDQGITFEWFDVDNVRLIKPESSGNGQKVYPYIEGTPQSPLHRVHFPAGHMGMMVFGRGVHRFHGNAVALSLHFLDVSHGVSTFEGNTAGWQADKETGLAMVPEEVQEVIPDSARIPHQKTQDSSLRQMFASFGHISRDFIEEVAERGINTDQPLNATTLNRLVRSLRDWHTLDIAPNGSNNDGPGGMS